MIELYYLITTCNFPVTSEQWQQACTFFHFSVLPIQRRLSMAERKAYCKYRTTTRSVSADVGTVEIMKGGQG